MAITVAAYQVHVDRAACGVHSGISSAGKNHHWCPGRVRYQLAQSLFQVILDGQRASVTLTRRRNLALRPMIVCAYVLDHQGVALALGLYSVA